MKLLALAAAFAIGIYIGQRVPAPMPPPGWKLRIG